MEGRGVLGVARPCARAQARFNCEAAPAVARVPRASGGTWPGQLRPVGAPPSPAGTSTSGRDATVVRSVSRDVIAAFNQAKENVNASDVGKFAGAFDPLAQILYQYAPWLLGVMGGLEKVLLKIELAVWFLGKGVILGLWELINDQWAPTEIWFPLVWFATYRSILKGIHFLSLELRQVFHRARCRIDAWRGIPPTKIEDETFEMSFWGWLQGPMRNLGYVFLASYVVDQVQLVMQHAGKDAVEVLAGAPWLKAFDTVVYTIWGASLLFDLKERYLARLPLFTKLSAGASQTQLEMIDKGVSLLIIVSTTAVGLQAVGLKAGALFVSSVGGLALSLAAKDILENFMAGLVIISKGRCQVGEVVRFGSMAGQVLKVGWLMTDIRDYNKLSLVSVPNSLIIRNGMDVETMNTHRKVRHSVVIPYENIEHVQSIINDIKDTFKAIRYIETFGTKESNEVRPPYHRPRCFIEELSPTGVVVTLAYLVGPVRPRGSSGGGLEAEVRTELNLAVAHILAKYGVSVAPNSIALYSMQNADFYSRNGFIGRGNGAAPKQPAPAEQQFQRYALD